MKIYDQLNRGGFLNPATIQGALVYAVVLALLAWLVGRLLRLTVERALAHDTNAHLDRMAVKFLAKLLRYCVYGVAVVVYAHLVPSLASLGTASLTSISVITVIVGLAAQNTLGNLVAGISLLLYRPFKLGDRLQIVAPTGVETGTIENLTLGYTLLKTDDNRRVVVPNSLMASQTTINLTGSDPRVICAVPFTISYSADIDQARGIILALATKHPRAQKAGPCPLTSLGASGMVLTVDIWCADALTAITLRCDLLEAVTKRFAAEGIAIPYPQTVRILHDAVAAPAAPEIRRP